MAYNPNLPAGQATMANSAPVVIASNQAPFPVGITGIVGVTGPIGVIQGSSFIVTANQGTSPWVVSGVIGNTGAIGITGPVSVTQGSSWIVNASPGASWSVFQGASWSFFGAGGSMGVLGFGGTMSMFGAGGTFSVVGFGGTMAVGGTMTVVGPGANAAAVVGNPVRIAGSDGTNTRNILTDASGRLTPLIGFVSTSNSRANASLGSGATFNGTFEDITQYVAFTILILDAGAQGGTLTINWSEDGVNTRDSDSVVVPTANGQQFAFGRKAQFFQVSYTHGAAAGNVVIQTILSTSMPVPSTHFGSDTITTGQDGQLVHSMNRVLSGTSFVNWIGDSSGVGYVASVTSTSGGFTAFRNTGVTNTAVAVKASAGCLYYYHVYNTNTSDVFLQIYDVASGSVTVGTTTPTYTLVVPAGGGILDSPFSAPMNFSTAITIAVTTTATGGTAPSTALLVNMGYK